jgi:hypothetical protein
MQHNEKEFKLLQQNCKQTTRFHNSSKQTGIMPDAFPQTDRIVLEMYIKRSYRHCEFTFEFLLDHFTEGPMRRLVAKSRKANDQLQDEVLSSVFKNFVTDIPGK